MRVYLFYYLQWLHYETNCAESRAAEMQRTEPNFAETDRAVKDDVKHIVESSPVTLQAASLIRIPDQNGCQSGRCLPLGSGERITEEMNCPPTCKL